MKLICSLKNRDMLETVSKYVEGVVLGCKYSFYSDKKYSKEEINEIYQIALQKNIKTYILLNLVMHENYVDEVKEFIESFKNEEVYFIFQDLGILNILLSLNKARYGIYNPLTMITNYRDLKEYEFFSLDAIGIFDRSLRCFQRMLALFAGFGELCGCWLSDWILERIVARVTERTGSHAPRYRCV